MGRHLGLMPPVIDEMEVWEIGEAFGLKPDGTLDPLHHPQREGSGQGAPPPSRAPYDPALLKARTQARLEGRPPPPLPSLPR